MSGKADVYRNVVLSMIYRIVTDFLVVLIAPNDDNCEIQIHVNLNVTIIDVLS